MDEKSIYIVICNVDVIILFVRFFILFFNFIF